MSKFVTDCTGKSAGKTRVTDGKEPAGHSAAAADMAGSNTIHDAVEKLCRRARAAAAELAFMPGPAKDAALHAIKDALSRERSDILAVNARDVRRSVSEGLKPAFIDRMTLNDDRFNTMLQGLDAVIALPDPAGRELNRIQVPSGLVITRRAIPLGVTGVIYESRPNVTADAAALCLKAGNAVILRGGSECAATNRTLVTAIRKGLSQAKVVQDAVQYVPDQSRQALDVLLQRNDCIDVLIPRGGPALTRKVHEQSRIPVFSHLAGLCHTYIHAQADPDMALAIITNAKMRRTGICGATETLLIDRSISATLLPRIVEKLAATGCEIRGDDAAVATGAGIVPATEEDWHTEYLDAVLAVKTVNGVDEAIAHIARYGSEHTDAIVTDNAEVAEYFLQRVNSASVMHNCSTQFADGGEYGMGAEIGIATGRLHARGPVGLEQLTTFKYEVRGTGQVRS